jgi:starvation-inducible outer membrane lipoprotein
MKSQMLRILKILAVLYMVFLLSGCITTLPKLHSGNAEIGFDVFATNTPQANQYDREFKPPTTFGIRIHY